MRNDDAFNVSFSQVTLHPFDELIMQLKHIAFSLANVIYKSV